VRGKKGKEKGVEETGDRNRKWKGREGKRRKEERRGKDRVKRIRERVGGSGPPHLSESGCTPASSVPSSFSATATDQRWWVNTVGWRWSVVTSVKPPEKVEKPIISMARTDANSIISPGLNEVISPASYVYGTVSMCSGYQRCHSVLNRAFNRNNFR